MLTAAPSQIDQNIHAWTHEVDHDRRQLLVVMQKIQECYQSISEDSMRVLAEDFQIQPAEVLSLATFFTALYTRPKGKYTFKICCGLSCDLRQKEDLVTLIQNKLGVKFGETSPDGLFCLECSQCMGMCDQGPVLSVNNQVFPRMTPQKLETIISFCKQGQNIPTSQPGFTSLALWEGRSETASYALISPGSVISRLNAYSPEALLDELVKNHVITEDLRSQISSSTSETTSQRVLVCNTDLPQAGSYMERILLADHYDLFLEGVLACAYLSEVHEGIIYLRPEYEGLYPVLASYLEKLKDPTQGKTISFPGGRRVFSIDIRTSPGFIAGGVGKALEIAVNSNRFYANGASPISSSVIPLNVQTIIEIGRYLLNINYPQETSTRIFAISGDCSLPGAYELPVNASIHDLLEISESHNPKAVQVGGVTGKFVLPPQFGNPLSTGKDIGDTSIIVYGPDTDFHNVAIKLLQYNISESCGQCAPCREGSVKLLEKFQTMKQGHRFSVLELNSIANCVQLTSKCEFGQTAVTAFQSLIQCFPELA